MRALHGVARSVLILPDLFAKPRAYRVLLLAKRGCLGG